MNTHKPNKIGALILLLCAIPMICITSCEDSDNTPDPIPLTDQELVIDALDGVWSVDIESSTIPNKLALGLETGSANIDIDPEGNGDISISGDLASYVSGGAFFVDESGSITNPSVEVNASSGLAIDNVSYTLAADQSTLTIGFSVSSARVSGLGTWELIVNLN